MGSRLGEKLTAAVTIVVLWPSEPLPVAVGDWKLKLGCDPIPGPISDWENYNVTQFVTET
jgi:hypothetical protein